MSRSKRKTSSRRQQAAPPEGPPLAMPAAEAADSPDQRRTGRTAPTDAAVGTASVTLTLPEGPCPGRQAGQGGMVSRTVCVLSCLVCLLSGILIGNWLPQLLDDVQRTDRPPQEDAAPPQGPPPSGEPARSEADAPSAAPNRPAAAAEKPVPAPLSQAQHIVQLEQALREKPNDAARWTELGNAYFDEKQYAKAIEAYGRSLALRPNNPNVLTDLGIMYRENGQYEQALKSFDQAIRLEPAHEHARFNKGIVLLFDLHRPAEAKAVWRELLRMNPRAVAPDGTRLHDLILQCDKPLPPRQQ